MDSRSAFPFLFAAMTVDFLRPYANNFPAAACLISGYGHCRAISARMR